MLKLCSFLCLLAVALAMPPQTEGDFQDAEAKHEDGGRIMGGKPTTIDKFPYQISLQKNGSHDCGGSIISPEWVLTAAHCVVNSRSKFSVRAGTSTRNSGGAIYDVAKIISHPSYNSSTYDYDIAVVRISGTFRFGRNVQTVELAKRSPAPNTDAVVTGWGRTSETGSLATVLQYLHVPVVSNSLCKDLYGNHPVTDRMICAGFISGGKDSCESDSGGPLVSGGVQVGVVSFGNGCARPNYPGVYSSVANLRSWIWFITGV